MTRLGEGGFDSSQAAGAFTILLTLTHARPDAAHTLHGLDASAPRTVQEKAALLREGEVVAVNQAGQLRNPDSRVVLERRVQGDLLAKYADSYQGISPAVLLDLAGFFGKDGLMASGAGGRVLSGRRLISVDVSTSFG